MTKRHSQTLLLLIACLASGPIWAQTSGQPRKWHFEMDLRYQHMVMWHNSNKLDSRYWDTDAQQAVDYHNHHSSTIGLFGHGFPRKYGGNSLLLMETYRPSERWTVGLGLGLSVYHQLDYNIVPLFALGRWHAWSRHPYAYVYGEAGVLGCPTLNVGYGASLRMGKRRRLSLKVGYDLQARMRSEVSTRGEYMGQAIYSNFKWTNTMHCLQGSVGIVF